MTRRARIIAVTSGKGGVGKSIVAVNLAEALAAEHYAVALVDADLGQGACAVLLNERPQATALDLARRTAAPERLFHETAAGVTLVTGAEEAGQHVGRETAVFGALDAALEALSPRHDFILIDTPAGADGAVAWALDRAEAAILVVVDEPTAIADAYRLVKMTWQADPAYPFYLVVNFADSAAAAQSAADRFGTVTTHFTGRAPRYLGWAPFSLSVRHSVSRQEPIFRTPGPVSDAFARLAEALTGTVLADEGAGRAAGPPTRED